MQSLYYTLNFLNFLFTYTGKNSHEYRLQRGQQSRCGHRTHAVQVRQSPFKYRASPCKVHSDTMYLCGLSWYHYGLTRTFVTCERCPHSINTDSVDPVKVPIHGCFFLCFFFTIASSLACALHIHKQLAKYC